MALPWLLLRLHTRVRGLGLGVGARKAPAKDLDPPTQRSSRGSQDGAGSHQGWLEDTQARSQRTPDSPHSLVHARGCRQLAGHRGSASDSPHRQELPLVARSSQAGWAAAVLGPPPRLGPALPARRLSPHPAFQGGSGLRHPVLRQGPHSVLPGRASPASPRGGEWLFPGKGGHPPGTATGEWSRRGSQGHSVGGCRGHIPGDGQAAHAHSSPCPEGGRQASRPGGAGGDFSSTALPLAGQEPNSKNAH